MGTIGWFCHRQRVESMARNAASFDVPRAAVRGLAWLLIAAGLASINQPTLAAGKSNPAPKLNVEEAPASREAKAVTSFAPIIKKVAQSVVNIYSTVTV